MLYDFWNGLWKWKPYARSRIGCSNCSTRAGIVFQRVGVWAVSTGNLDILLNQIESDRLAGTDQSILQIMRRYPSLSQKQAKEIYRLISAASVSKSSITASLVATIPPSFSVKAKYCRKPNPRIQTQYFNHWIFVVRLLCRPRRCSYWKKPKRHLHQVFCKQYRSTEKFW